MTQKIVCEQGHCFDDGTLQSRFSKLVRKSDLADQINNDLLMEQIN